jgi:CubicO group peptidase (beta-lactamase class C family)
MTQLSRREALRLAAALAVVANTPAAAQQAADDWRLPSDDEIRRLIAARNAPRPGQGIVIGILGPEGERIVAGGTGAGAGFDSTTLFEIGSITKVFTALLLADMANKGEVSLDDPAAKYLPAGHRMASGLKRRTGGPPSISRGSLTGVPPSADTIHISDFLPAVLGP